MICLKCDHKRPRASNDSKTSTQFEHGNGDHINHNKSRFNSGGCDGNMDKSAGQDRNLLKGANKGRFVNEENEDQGCIDSWTEKSKFIDFPIVGGKTILSHNTEVQEKWKLEMSQRIENPTRIIENDESRCTDGQRKIEFLESSDDDEMAAWFKRK